MPIAAVHKKSLLSPVCLISILGLLFITNTAFAFPKRHHPKTKAVAYPLTVLQVIPAEKDATYIEVTFRLSPRIYKLAKDANPHYLELLKQSQRQHRPVMVSRAKEESDVIVRVAPVGKTRTGQ